MTSGELNSAYFAAGGDPFARRAEIKSDVAAAMGLTAVNAAPPSGIEREVQVSNDIDLDTLATHRAQFDAAVRDTGRMQGDDLIYQAFDVRKAQIMELDQRVNAQVAQDLRDFGKLYAEQGVYAAAGEGAGFVIGKGVALAAPYIGRAVGNILRWGANAEGETLNLVPRLGPKGVDPLHHNANVLIRDSSGNIVAHQRFVSGNMTLEEQALGFPRNTLASHTEARAVSSMELRSGDTMTITGQSPPCPSCKGAMNRAAADSGATIRYQWRQDGRTIIWIAKPKGY